MALKRTPKGGYRASENTLETGGYGIDDFPGCCGAKVVRGFPDFGGALIDTYVYDKYGNEVDYEEGRPLNVKEQLAGAKEFTNSVRSDLRAAQAIGTTYAKYGKLLAKCGWQVSKPWINPATKNVLITVSIGKKKGAR